MYFSETNTSTNNGSNNSIFHHQLTYEDNHNTFEMTSLILLSLIIMIVNGFVIIVFISYRKIWKRATNVMICSQACADLYTGIVFIPFHLVQTEESESLQPFVNGYMLYVAMFNLLALCIERYLAILRPFLHYRIMDIYHTRKVIILVWVVPFVLTSLPLIWWFQRPEVKYKIQKIYVCTQWTLILIIVLLMTTLYLFITKKATQSIRDQAILRLSSCANRERLTANKLSRKELRVVHLFGLLLCFLVAAYSPILYMNLVVVILNKPSYVPLKLIDVSLYLLVLNSVVNPILCILMKKDYLDAINKLKYILKLKKSKK